MLGLRRAVAIAAAVLPLLVCVPATAATPLSFGMFAQDVDRYGPTVYDRLERRLGRRIEIEHTFMQWSWASPELMAQRAADAHARGRIPMISWEAWAILEATEAARTPRSTVDQRRYRLARIIDGSHDQYIAAVAAALARVPGIVYLRPMHEMNGNWYPWSARANGNHPSEVAPAWRHIHDVFAAAGATNVRWVWSPIANDFPPNKFERLYPGPAYVDVLGLSGFNWGAAHPRYGGHLSFRRRFADAYHRITRLGRHPLWITETASAGRSAEKARWVRGMFRTARSWRRLRAIVWFDVKFSHVDWRSSASPEVARAFRED